MEFEQEAQKKYKQASIGTHTGICYMVASLGTQKETFEGIESEKKQIAIGWELPEELTDDGQKRLTVVKTYTLSLNEKAGLLKDYSAWTKETKPKKYVFDKLLGMGCNLNIGHTSGGNAKVMGVSALKSSEKVSELSVASVLFDVLKPDEMEMARLPSFLKDKIVASPEYQNFVLTQGEGSASKPGDDFGDSVPF